MDSREEFARILMAQFMEYLKKEHPELIEGMEKFELRLENE